MPLVTGTLTDIGLEPLTGLSPRLLFTPSSPAVRSDGYVFATRPVEAVPAASGAFSVDLAHTNEVLPVGTHWRIQVDFRGTSTDGGYPNSDYLPFKLFVPAGGGSIADLIGEYVANDWVYQGPDAPLLTNKARWHLNTNSGDLFELQQGSFVKIANLKGPKGDQGIAGTFTAATAESVAPGSPAEAIIGGTPAAATVHFKIPEGRQGLPGVNAVENDEAVAFYINDVDTLTRAALDARYVTAVTTEHGTDLYQNGEQL